VVASRKYRRDQFTVELLTKMRSQGMNAHVDACVAALETYKLQKQPKKCTSFLDDLIEAGITPTPKMCPVT
jgi:hypothetical protein